MENQDHFLIRFYPNPANDILKIHCGKNTFHTAKLIDLNGKVILFGELKNDGYSFNLSNVPSGYYLIDLEGETSKLYEKIMIQH
jgi:hypothetical protein